MTSIEALECMRSGLPVEQLFRDPLAVREMLMFTDKGIIELFLPDFKEGVTDVMTPALFLKSYEDAQFVLYDQYKVT